MGAWVVLVGSMLVGAPPAPGGEWSELPPLPDRRGFAGCFAGVSHGTLLAAGGANFPGKPPWEGGPKVWNDAVYALEPGASAWKEVGRLPRALGYGVSATHGESVICVGGSDGQNASRPEAFRLELLDNRLVTTPLPSLPEAVANVCGALVGDTLHVAGGITRGNATDASTAAWVLDLNAPDGGWKPLPPLPGPGRMLATAASCDGAFWVAGGVSLEPTPPGAAKRVYRRETYRLDPSATRWTRMADLPTPRAASASPAPATPDGAGFLLLGGDDGSNVTTPPDHHPGFSRTVLRYDARRNAWEPAGDVPVAAATLACVPWQGGFVLISGEVRPGVRTPRVWRRAMAAPETGHQP